MDEVEDRWLTKHECQGTYHFGRMAGAAEAAEAGGRRETLFFVGFLARSLSYSSQISSFCLCRIRDAWSSMALV